MLLNIVKLRYADTPAFLDVGSVISQYEYAAELNASLGWGLPEPGSDSQSLGGAGRYAERPTITYVPIAGAKFTQSLMTPVPPSGVLFLLQAGYPVRVYVPYGDSWYPYLTRRIAEPSGEVQDFVTWYQFDQDNEDPANDEAVGNAYIRDTLPQFNEAYAGTWNWVNIPDRKSVV
mgnify:CR=1 FL=1